MLGFIISDQPGETDLLLRQVAAELLVDGIALTGVTQVTDRTAQDAREKMVLHVLPDGPELAISQDLGRLAEGCSLDPEGLEQAVGLVASALETAPALVLLNKFGKQESEGHGFRAVIGEALMQDIPVLIGVGRAKLPAFTDFAGEFAQELPRELPALLHWCRENAKRAVTT